MYFKDASDPMPNLGPTRSISPGAPWEIGMDPALLKATVPTEWYVSFRNPNGPNLKRNHLLFRRSGMLPTPGPCREGQVAYGWIFSWPAG